MDRVKAEMAAKFPDVRTFFQSGSMQDAILNQGQPAPIDVQVNTRDLELDLRHRAGSGATAFASFPASARSTSRRT